MNARWWKAPETGFLDRRLQKLPAGLFRFWFNLNCVASWSGGRLPPVEDIAFLLRSSVATVERRLAALADAGLIILADGAPQFVDGAADLAPAGEPRAKPMSGAERIRRWRERKAAGVTARNDAETARDREDEKDEESAPGGASENDGFEAFWRIFPKREGDNPQEPARAAYRKAVAAGAPPALLLAAAHAYAAVTASRERKFIASAARWLSEGRWRDEAQKPDAAAPPIEPPGVWIAADSPEWAPWSAHWRTTKGKSPPVDGRNGWRFPTLHPPAAELAAA